MPGEMVRWMVSPGGTLTPITLSKVAIAESDGWVAVTPAMSPDLPYFGIQPRGSRQVGVDQQATLAIIRASTSGTGTAKPPATFTPATTEQTSGPFISYLQQMGLGAGYLNPAQQYQANLYQPLRSLFQLQQPYISAATPGATLPSWSDYLNKMVGGAGGMSNIYREAEGVLQRLFGMGSSGRQEIGMNFEPEYDPATGTLMRVEGGKGKTLAELQALIEMGLGQRLAGGASRYVAERIPAYQQTWQQQQAAGAPSTSFLDYLQQRLGM